MIKQLTKGMIEALPASPKWKSTWATPSMDAQKPESANTRNGAGQKTLKSEHGELAISVPRDRDGSFEPLLVKKRQSRLEGQKELLGMWMSENEGARILAHGLHRATEPRHEGLLHCVCGWPHRASRGD